MDKDRKKIKIYQNEMNNNLSNRKRPIPNQYKEINPPSEQNERIFNQKNAFKNGMIYQNKKIQDNSSISNNRYRMENKIQKPEKFINNNDNNINREFAVNNINKKYINPLVKQHGSVTVLPEEVGGWSFSEDSTLMTYEGESGVNFVCGLDELDPVVSDYVETTGGWSFEVIPNDLGNESTGAQLVIYDETGEEVESYEIVMFGDVTGDCIIDASDCSLTLSLMVGEGEYGDFLMVDEGAHPFAADTDHNGMLDASDISVILEMAVGDSEWGQTL